MKAVSLFSNCGAGDVGFSAAGFRFSVISELVEKRLEVARLNHPDAVAVSGDLRSTWPVVIDSFRETHGSDAPVLLSGCPPCQGMSSARGDRGKENDPDAGSRDGRNLLVLPIAKVAKELRPTFVVVENVPAFLRRKVWDTDSTTPLSAAQILCNRLGDEYSVYAAVVDLCEFGVPQHRSRAFLTLVRKGTEALRVLQRTGRAPFPAPTHGGPDGPKFVTIDDALKELDLPALDAGSSKTARSTRHPMHRVPVWPDRRYGMVAAIPPGSGASAWETDKCGRCKREGIARTEAMCPSCQSPLQRPTVRNPDGSWRLVKGFRSSSYRRMDPARPAATLTTASGHIGSDRTLHPWENRVLSPAECAWLQTFPSTFKWGDMMDTWGHTGVRQMIGEAVPPRFTMLHGRVLADLAEGRDVPEALSQRDGRCQKALEKLDSAR
ncbi:MAG: DNA cytosine methyltransferase [Acidimicrobiia bacterium]|nr:DNA cytosine methyltransferase [Acidimicrobiia bacterium]